MSQLTDEQRKRIEENRRKALEIRAKKFYSSTDVKTNSSAPPSKDIASFNSKPKTFPLFNGFSNKPNFNSNSKNGTYATSNTLSNVKKNTEVGASNKNPFEVQLKGNCILLSRKRFYVNIGYHKELIEIFKTVPSKLYDVQTKKWNFHIEDHDKLISLSKPLQPSVFIVPLPKLILKIFSNATDVRKIEEQDLSSLDPELLKTLLPFQKEGVNFAIQRGGRILIADDMGLGKTIQAIAIANYFSKDWPILVVTPSSVRYSWLESFYTWLPSLDREEISVINSGKDHIPNNKVILLSYDLLSKLQSSLINRKFKTVIFDESHFLKNNKSARTKAAQALMKNVNRIIMLSGTPALSRPIELYTQLSALRKDFFSYMEYGMRYCNGKQMHWGPDFTGSSNMEELQIILEEILMIRRLKSDVIRQLPAKIRQMIVLDPALSKISKVLKEMSRQMREDNLKGMEWRGVLLKYFHETAEVKLKAVVEYVTDLLEADKKFICFAHHQSMMNGICHAVEAKNIDYIRIDGSVTSDQRKKLCDKFQVSDMCKVAVLSITSANCGITLTSASLVVFAELFWNPGILVQAEDRAHRIGQEDSVVVQYLVAKGTADDEIWPMVQSKLDILNKAGLSKDNFKSADTLIRKDVTQPNLESFWGELNDSLNTGDFDFNLDFDVPEKRLKLDSD